MKVAEIPTSRASVPRKNPYARWRAGTLILVYLLMAVHIVHWRISGETLAPLELNEVMYTLELGIVTAGFLFMLGVTLATMVFGRVFCSWGCHILALQDLSAWILGKVRIRPKAIRSRVLAWVPVVAALYMFVWPQALRLLYGAPLPRLHMRNDAQGWASLVTENFWRNLPTPAIAILTFGVCGFLVVYVLGSRGFCTYGCPYGAIFRLADRVAPGRIRLKEDDCLSCGACTAVCKSHIRVHEELNRYGMVVNPACLRDLDCVAACPKGSVAYGFGLPSVLGSIRNHTPIKKDYDFSYAEEAVLAMVFLIVLVVYRGLYDLIPFLLSIGFAAIAAYLMVLCVRLYRQPSLQLNRRQLKHQGRLTFGGYVFTAAITVFMLFTAHSAIVHYHAFQGHRLTVTSLGQATLNEPIARLAIRHLSVARLWGLVPVERIQTGMANLQYQLAGHCFRFGRLSDAEADLRATLDADPHHVMAHYDLGALLMKQGQSKTAIEHLRQATELKPDFADGHYNLGLVLWMSGAHDEARREIDAAYKLNPTDDQTTQLRALMAETSTP